MPTSPDDPARRRTGAGVAGAGGFGRPFLTAFSDGDPITGATAADLPGEMRGASGYDHPLVHDAGHFLQEDAGEELAKQIVDFLQN